MFPSSVIFARVIVMLLALKGLSSFLCRFVIAVTQESSAAVMGVAVGAAGLVAVPRPDAAVDGAL